MFNSSQEKTAEDYMGAILLKTGDGGRDFWGSMYHTEHQDQLACSKGEKGEISSDAGLQGQEMAVWITQTAQISDSVKENKIT